MKKHSCLLTAFPEQNFPSLRTTGNFRTRRRRGPNHVDSCVAAGVTRSRPARRLVWILRMQTKHLPCQTFQIITLRSTSTDRKSKDCKWATTWNGTIFCHDTPFAQTQPESRGLRANGTGGSRRPGSSALSRVEGGERVRISMYQPCSLKFPLGVLQRFFNEE